MSTTDPTAETLPNVQQPNPYTFAVSVSYGVFSGCWFVYLTDDTVDNDDMNWRFPTKEEADTHAALILAALHQAVME